MANPSLQIGNSNWAIKEDNLLGYSTAGTKFLPQPITMTRASAGTRVNSSGLVETVELLGSEDVVNGSFTTDSDWNTSATGISIAGGKLSRDATATLSIVQLSSVITPSVTYKITFEIVDYTSGTLTPRFGYNGTGGTAVSGVGTYTQIITKVDQNVIELYGTAFVGSIDNVSVKEVTRNNLARVDYDGTASSLLVEPQSTNRITYSEAFSNWTLSQTTISTGSTSEFVSPEGSNNSTKLIANATNSEKQIKISVIIPNATENISVFAKKGGYNFLLFRQSTSDNSYNNISFNLSTGQLGTIGANYSDAKIEDFGNDWYRCSFNISNRNAANIQILVAEADNTEVFTGDGSSGIYIWGAQVVTQSFLTSYIPTSGSSVTRVADQYEKTGISNLINSEEGVLFVEIAALSDDITYRAISMSNNTVQNQLLMEYEGATNKFRAYLAVSNNIDGLISVTINTIQDNKIAFKYAENDLALWINGVEVGSFTGTKVMMPVNTMTNLRFTRGNNTQPFYGKVKQLQVFKTALTDSELATLTTI